MGDLHWDGLRNVRDLGAQPTPLSPTGATIAGRVARGPRRELLTSAGWDAASAWGVRSIIDLRSADEVGRRGGHPDAVVPDAVVVTLAPTEDQAHSDVRAVCLPTWMRYSTSERRVKRRWRRARAAARST